MKLKTPWNPLGAVRGAVSFSRNHAVTHPSYQWRKRWVAGEIELCRGLGLIFNNSANCKSNGEISHYSFLLASQHRGLRKLAEGRMCSPTDRGHVSKSLLALICLLLACTPSAISVCSGMPPPFLLPCQVRCMRPSERFVLGEVHAGAECCSEAGVEK